MEQFDKISISEISKKDMNLILKALLYAGEGTNDSRYIDLRNNFIEELSLLINCSREEFLDLMSK
jgi:hypothetical protein